VIDPVTGEVKLTMLGETSSKHDFALGKTGAAPTVPGLLDTQALDNARAINNAQEALWENVTGIGRPDDGATRNVPTGEFDEYAEYKIGDMFQYEGATYLVVAEDPNYIGFPYPFDNPNFQLFIPAGGGTQGVPGVNAISGFLTSEAVQLFAYANGGVVSYAPATGSFKVFSGNTDVSEYFSLSTLHNPQALTVSYSGRTYSVTGGFDENEDTATLTITAYGITGSPYMGVGVDKVLSLSKVKGGYEIVSALPTTNLFEGRIVFLTTDDKLYRYTGIAWTSAVPAVDISGTLADAQIAALAASKITGQLSDSQLAAIAAAKLTGQITGTQITDGAISTAKLSAGSVTTAALAADAVTADKIAANSITSAELAAGSVTAGKLAAGAIVAGTIAADAITANEIAANAITATELAANAVTADKVAAGAITAAKIGVTQLSAITATIGLLRTATTGARTEINDNLIEIFDASNVRRVRLGVWT
jgi:hypothetical protein